MIQDHCLNVISEQHSLIGTNPNLSYQAVTSKQVQTGQFVEFNWTELN